MYAPDNPPVPGDHRILDAWETGARGLKDFMVRYSGCSFAGGMYRVHAVADIPKWTRICVEAFPRFANRVLCFASDWMGNQFAIDSKRADKGEYQILLFDIGTGEALEVPATFKKFHDEELTQDPEAALAASFFQRWLSSGGAAPHRDQCIGYNVPLSLGGKDDVSNLEVTDMGVYWLLSAQIRSQTERLPPGTRVTGIKID